MTPVVAPYLESVEEVVSGFDTTATGLTGEEAAARQLVSIIQRRSVHGFVIRYQLHNRSFWRVAAAAAVIMVRAVRRPVLRDSTVCAGLGSTSDWRRLSFSAFVKGPDGSGGGLRRSEAGA